MFRFFTVLALGAVLFATSPVRAEGVVEVFAAGTIAPDAVTPKVSSKEGVLQIENTWPTTVRLADFDVKSRKIDQSVVTFTADMEAVNFVGKAYLEMWLHFPGKGFFFSRGLSNQVTQDGGWKTYKTDFVLKKDERPDNIVLNVRFEGAGTLRVKNLTVTSDTGATVPAAPPQEAEKPAKKDKE